MSPKKWPKNDGRWERTQAGVMVPRWPTIPTRRYIGKLGMVKDCCDTATVVCTRWGNAIPDEVQLEISGLSSGALCDCSDIDGIFTLVSEPITNILDCQLLCKDDTVGGDGCACLWKYDFGVGGIACGRYLWLKIRYAVGMRQVHVILQDSQPCASTVDWTLFYAGGASVPDNMNGMSIPPVNVRFDSNPYGFCQQTLAGTCTFSW